MAGRKSLELAVWGRRRVFSKKGGNLLDGENGERLGGATKRSRSLNVIGAGSKIGEKDYKNLDLQSGAKGCRHGKIQFLSLMSMEMARGKKGLERSGEVRPPDKNKGPQILGRAGLQDHRNKKAA